MAAGGKNFRTGGGKVTSMGGPPPPQRVAITEWDNVEKAQAFFKSKVWNDLAPASRRYAAMWWKNGTKSINAQSGGRFIWRSPSK